MNQGTRKSSQRQELKALQYLQRGKGKKRDRIDMTFYREICEVAYKLFGF